MTEEQRKNSQEIIEHSDSTKKEIKKYTSLLRSFIPEKMVYVIAVNISDMNDSNYESYRTLVKNYAMLEHISFDFLYKKANNQDLLNIIKNQHTYPTEIRKLEEKIDNLTTKVDPLYSNPNENVYLKKHEEMLTKLSEDNNLSDNPILNYFNSRPIISDDIILTSFLPYIEKAFKINIPDEFKTEYINVWNSYFQWRDEQSDIHWRIKTTRDTINFINQNINNIKQLKKDIEGCISHQLIIELGEAYFNSNQIYQEIKQKFNDVGFEFPIYKKEESPL